MSASLPVRTWHLGDPNDDGSLHALGNGRLLVYGRGPDVVKVWGPFYTSPNLVALAVAGPSGLTARSSRELTGGVWQHALELAGSPVGALLDTVDRDLPCFTRRVRTEVPLAFRLDLPHALPLRRDGAAQVLIGIVPPGTVEYGRRFVSASPRTVLVRVQGEARCETTPEGGWTLVCTPGTSEILIACGAEYPDCMRAAEEAVALGTETILARTRKHWAAFLAGLQIPAVPGALGEDLGQAAADTALAITSQQAQEGAVVAGHNYCLGYVRDQYGVARGLLALGLHQRARAILDFYWGVFQREGVLHNAQSIGPLTRFHVHENDEVEITGWLVLQVFDYLAATGDDAYVRQLLPLLEWCVEAQERHCVAGMLPLNGDETYVAGGMVPREALDDGSAEATLIYLAGLRRLAAWCAGQGVARSQAEIWSCRADALAARYRANFFVDSRLLVNNPARRQGLVRTRFRHGVCQARLPGCRFMDWLELSPGGLYACPACFPQVGDRSNQEERRFFLPSVATLPAFVGHAVAEPPEQTRMLAAALAPFLAADGSLRWPEGSLPGYELGMLLGALAANRDPHCQTVAELLLRLREPTGVWCEYYVDGRPRGTRYRPWESAINLCGLLHAAQAGAFSGSHQTNRSGLTGVPSGGI